MLIRGQNLADFTSRILNDPANLILALTDDFLNCFPLFLCQMQCIIQLLQKLLGQKFRRTQLGVSR